MWEIDNFFPLECFYDFLISPSSTARSAILLSRGHDGAKPRASEIITRSGEHPPPFLPVGKKNHTVAALSLSLSLSRSLLLDAPNKNGSFVTKPPTLTSIPETHYEHGA